MRLLVVNVWVDGEMDVEKFKSSVGSVIKEKIEELGGKPHRMSCSYVHLTKETKMQLPAKKHMRSEPGKDETVCGRYVIKERLPKEEFWKQSHKMVKAQNIVDEEIHVNCKSCIAKMLERRAAPKQGGNDAGTEGQGSVPHQPPTEGVGGEGGDQPRDPSEEGGPVRGETDAPGVR